jgi:hypothetical protein
MLPGYSHGEAESASVLRIPLRGTRLRRAVDPGASASPEGLTARARPEARPYKRAANLRSAAGRPIIDTQRVEVNMLNVTSPIIQVITTGTDWPAIAAAGATAVAAVAGIWGTAWQARRAREAASHDLRQNIEATAENLRRGIDAENKRALIAERRRLYAEFLASVDTLMPITLNYRYIKEQGISGEERDKAFDDLTEAEGVMMKTSMEARLIAPRSIRLLIGSVVEAYLKYGLDSMSGVTELVKVEEPVPVSCVIDAMQADLGYDTAQEENTKARAANNIL